jgi:hypothetical protein
LPTLRASPIVIPGCARLRADPESSIARRFWIPGSREGARPGMTALKSCVGCCDDQKKPHSLGHDGLRIAA